MSKRTKTNSIDDILFYKSIGEKIKSARHKNINGDTGTVRLCTQTEIANACNCTFQQIQKYEKGTNRISLIKLLMVAEYLDKPLNYFINQTKLSGLVKLPDDNSVIVSESHENV